MLDFVTFFNSSFFLALATFLVGGFAIYLYKKQQYDTKRNAAALILQEIRYAEQQIRNSDRGGRGYSLSSKLLPTNSWNDNVHRFIKELTETEIDMISRFYSQASFIDWLIAERSKQKINQKFQPVEIPGNAPVQLASFTQQQVTNLMQVPNPNEEITNRILLDVSRGIEYIYNTPSVDKLRQAVQLKWHTIF